MKFRIGDSVLYKEELVEIVGAFTDDDTGSIIYMILTEDNKLEQAKYTELSYEQRAHE